MSSIHNDFSVLKPFEHSSVYKIVDLNSKIEASDQLLRKAKELDEKIAGLELEEKQLEVTKQEIERQHTKKLKRTSLALKEVQYKLVSKEEQKTKLQKVHKILKERYEALKSDRPLQEDQDLINRLIEDQTKTQNEKLSQIEVSEKKIQEKLNSISEAIKKDEEAHKILETDLNLFEKGEVPEQYAIKIDDAVEKANDNQNKKTQDIIEEIDFLEIEHSQLVTKNKNLEREIIELKANDFDLKQVSSKSLIDKFQSPLWKPFRDIDYFALKAEEVSHKLNSNLQDLEIVEKQLSSKTTLLSDTNSERSSIIEKARLFEQDKQQKNCQLEKNKLFQKIESDKSQQIDFRAQLDSQQKDREKIKLSLEKSKEQLIKENRQKLIGCIRKKIKQLSFDLDEADSEVKEANELVNEKKLIIEQQNRSFVEEITALKTNSNSQLDELQKSVYSSKESLLCEAKNLGIEIKSSNHFDSINTGRSKLKLDLKKQYNVLKLKGENTRNQDKEYSNSGTHQLNAVDQESIRAKGNIYFDFSRNEDDLRDQGRGGNNRGLHSQMDELKNRIGTEFFPESTYNEELLSIFINAFFPEDIPQSYYISNISVNSNQPYLSIRPQIIGPRLEKLLPLGMTLTVCGRLWDNLNDIDNPVFSVERIIEISHSNIRPFELLISSNVFHLQENVYPARHRGNNVLSNNFISKLPLISKKTQNRLKKWRAYLDWRERIVNARSVGLRYISVKFEEDGRLGFLTVCESKEKFNQISHTLKNKGEVYAHNLGHSKDHWHFLYNSESRQHVIAVGDFLDIKMDVKNLTDFNIGDLPWDEPFFSIIYFQQPEDNQYEFGDTAVEKKSNGNLKKIPRNGFLALSVIGDNVLINRQRKELKRLQSQSGFAPFLSSYLFDIKAAKGLSNQKIVQPEQWYQSDLNQGQRQAVQKMISVPDIALVQGPPGTGKTTMIAEAAWQYVLERKKVLLVSQASLAVNNALERLGQNPVIRAIRLSKRPRKDEQDNPYSQDRALGTYYHSIAATCKEKWLDAWMQDCIKEKNLSDDLNSFEQILGDLKLLRKREKKIKKHQKNLREKKKNLRENEEKSELNQIKRTEILSFRNFINGGTSFSGIIPDQILQVFYDHITVVISNLVKEGIQLNTFWHQPRYGSPLERTEWAVEVLLNWRNLIEFKQQILGDLNRLKISNKDLALSLDTAKQMSDLEQKLEAIQKELENDESKLPEWQNIQKKIREIKRNGTGLDYETYSKILNTPNQEILKELTHYKTKRTKVIELLSKLNCLINEYETKISEGIEVVSNEIEAYLDSLVFDRVNKDCIKSIDNQLKNNLALLNDILTEISDKEDRLNEIIGKYPRKQDTSKNFKAFRTQIIQELNTFESRTSRSKTIRESWENILVGWVKDLIDAETIQNDNNHEEYFFEEYIKACNVVGVTCTEDRRTLEDAGHVWFNTVIVDEISKATPTEFIMPLMMARNAILVGDHRQLPPLFNEFEGSWSEVITEQEENEEDDQNSESELTTENFDKFKRMVTSSLFKEHFENASNSIKSSLLTQYRMHPDIMKIVNKFYENRLHCGLRDPDGTDPCSDPKGHRIHGLTLGVDKSRPYINPKLHVAWLDSSKDPCGRNHYEMRLGNSKTNELEGYLIAKTLCDIELSCRKQGYGSNGKAPKEVGIITFYRGQLKTIKKAISKIKSLSEINFYAIKYDLNTVDRYQGQERPIILVSMVRSPKFKLSSRANTAQFERINVAFSRARELLIVVGAKQVFNNYHVEMQNLDRPGKRTVRVYRQIIKEIELMGGFWSSSDIIPLTEYNKLYPPSKRPYNRRNQSKYYHRDRSRK